MRRTRWGLCLAVLFTLSLAYAPAANAEEPDWASCQKASTGGTYLDKSCSQLAAEGATGGYELSEPGIGKGKASKVSSSGAATFHVVVPGKGDTQIVCASFRLSGKPAVPNQLTGAIAEFKGCEAEGAPCQSAGGKGRIASNPLLGELGYIDGSVPRVGLSLTSEASPGSGYLMQFTCGGATQVRIAGSLLGELTGDINAVSKTATLSFTVGEYLGEPQPGYKPKTNVPGFEGGAGGVLKAELNSPETGGAWQPEGGLPAGLASSPAAVKGEALSVRAQGKPGPCNTNFEKPTLDESGKVVLPAGAENEGEEAIDEQRGSVSKIFPQFDTSVDTWYEKEPCDPSIGGEVPAEALPGGSEDVEAESEEALEELETSLTPQEATTGLGEIGGHIEESAEMVPPGTVLPKICGTTKDGKSCKFGTAGAPALDSEKPFGGRDVILVHGFETKPFAEEFDASSPVLPTWPTDPDAFLTKTGHWKKEATAGYWQNYIDTWLHGKFPGARGRFALPAPNTQTNRYLVADWAPTQRLFIGAHAVLTEIQKAMATGDGVEVEPGQSKEGFCAKGCVIISHSTGGPVVDVAMALAKKTTEAGTYQQQFGNLKPLLSRIRAHVALHGAFDGSGFGSLAVGVAESLIPVGNLSCKLLVLVANELGADFSGCDGLSRLQRVIPTSVLVDLVPAVTQNLWGPWINETPVPTITTAGGHPTANGVNSDGWLARTIVKRIVLPGLDDGVLNLDSQCANPLPYFEQPITYELNAPIIGRRNRLYDMGVTRKRAVGFLNGQYKEAQLPGQADAGCLPFLSPDGMRQPWGFGWGEESRYANHFSFLESVSDHKVGPLNEGETPYLTECYLATSPSATYPLEPDHVCSSPAEGQNREDIRVVTNKAVYEPLEGCKGTALECAPLLNKAVKTMVVREVVGRVIRWKLFGHRHAWWVWKRLYDRLDKSMEGGEQGWQENDYIANYVLR